MANNELIFQDDEFIVSKTDTSGRITYGNDLFIQISGYSEKELLHSPHNILRHPDMPKLIFKLLWERVQNGKEIFAYVKNQTKDKNYYWVFAHVTPSYDNFGKIIGFHSVRRKPTTEALSVIIPLYRSLLNGENSGGLNVSQSILDEQLSQSGKSYDQFILSL
ncbi:MAG: PAS domain-containing protein [Sulfuricurvum sp.]|uniref:PAS domain-containing protein n=1 Tax=Sulfuricurvum sp. TaxID=2025608 RepID=UPI0026059ABE|nr:PAS domain-containing protein [Sulfuricurvum sp.]MDD5160005.1 PAS domain-containing protein [Sulfuricurvum sp.]